MSDLDRTVEAVKKQLSPKVPCVNADADGYCKNGGFICCTCEAYRPVKAGKELAQVLVEMGFKLEVA